MTRLLGLAALLLVACPRGRSQQDAAAALPPPRAPRAVEAPIDSPPRPVRAADGAPEAGSPARARPRVLWTSELDHRIERIHVTSAGMIVVVGPAQVTALDPRGRALWHQNLAPGDRVVGAGGRCTHVALADGDELLALDDRGRQIWSRPVDGEPSTLSDGTLLAIDAAAVRALACRGGRETWAFTPDRQRRLRLLSAGPDRVTFLGERAERRTLFVLGLDGALRREAPLPEGTRYAEELSDGRIVARGGEWISLLEPGGRTQWSRPIAPAAEVGVLGDMVTTATAGRDGRVVMASFDLEGRPAATCNVLAGADTVSLRVLGGRATEALVAACAGPLSACAEQAAGPFNRLWGCPVEGDPVEVLSRRDDVFFDATVEPDRPVTLAASRHGGDTEVIEVARSLVCSTLVELPGRRMIGPVAGPGGAWLVATCAGQRCEAPYRLFAVAAEEDYR